MSDARPPGRRKEPVTVKVKTRYADQQAIILWMREGQDAQSDGTLDDMGALEMMWHRVLPTVGLLGYASRNNADVVTRLALGKKCTNVAGYDGCRLQVGNVAVVFRNKRNRQADEAGKLVQFVVRPEERES